MEPRSHSPTSARTIFTVVPWRALTRVRTSNSLGEVVVGVEQIGLNRRVRRNLPADLS